MTAITVLLSLEQHRLRIDSKQVSLKQERCVSCVRADQLEPFISEVKQNFPTGTNCKEVAMSVRDGRRSKYTRGTV